MIDKITEQINAFLSTLRTTYNQQGQTGRILLALLFVFLFCCLCAAPVSLLPRLAAETPSTAIPSPVLLPSATGGPTPTALFDFDFPTFTPFPTQPFATALPTLTPLSTETASPTPLAPTATGTALPSLTPTSPPSTATNAGTVGIVNVNKPLEYVEIRNGTGVAVQLRGWRLVSETGNQSCPLRGTLEPGEILRIWARQGEPGIDCRFGFNIWNDNTPDPAVLYNAQGEEVSRFP